MTFCAALTFSAGCEPGEFKVSQGRDFNEQRVNVLVKGRTTRDEVRTLFGEPYQTRATEEGEEWEYFVERGRSRYKLLSLIPFGGREFVVHRLTITFAGYRVADFKHRREEFTR